jgi:hypothetical protein
MAAGTLAYVGLLVALTKLARAALLSQSTHSARPWVVLTMVWGYDLALAALCGLLAHGLGRLPWRRTVNALGSLLLVLLVVVHVFDIGANALTGGPLTYQRLRGDEGGTLADLGLVARNDLLAGLITIGVLCLLIWPVLYFAPRLRMFRRAAELRVLGVALVLGAAGGYGAAHFLRRSLGLETQSVVTLLSSGFENQSFVAVELTRAEWARRLKPGAEVKVKEHAPPPLAAVRPKNVVVFLAEGIPLEHTGFGGHDRPNPTPKLSARMQQQGMLFTRYYAHWHASNQAIFSVACSALPPLSGDIMRQKPRIDCGEFSQVMHDRGLHPGLFHGGRFSFYNKLALLGRRGYEQELDSEELMRANPRWQRMRWGTDDRAMVEATLKWVDSLHKGDHFAALLISVAPHYPYELPRSWAPRPFAGNSEKARFLNGVYYIDEVFDSLVRGFEARGLANDTLFVFLGDHGSQLDERPRITAGRRTFYESSLHVPLVLLNPRLFPPSMPAADRFSDRVGGHEDLLPTLLDALGTPPDPRHHGQSLFRNEGWPRRMFFAANGGRYIGFVEGDHKFAAELRAHRTEYYDLAADPEEIHDLSDEFPDRMDQYSRDAESIAGGVTAELAAMPVLNEQLSLAQLYDRFRKDVQASLERNAKGVACPPDAHGDNRICPGVGALFSQRDVQLMGERRRCLFVRVPEDATIRLRVRDPITLSLLTSTVATVSLDDPEETTFHLTTTVDGLPLPRASIRPTQPEYIDHARGHEYVEYAISRDHKGEPDQLCLQFARIDTR